eukprot:scaffold27968_cov30-Tisochrysis_lutea.AAC.1
MPDKARSARRPEAPSSLPTARFASADRRDTISAVASWSRCIVPTTTWRRAFESIAPPSASACSNAATQSPTSGSVDGTARRPFASAARPPPEEINEAEESSAATSPTRSYAERWIASVGARLASPSSAYSSSSLAAEAAARSCLASDLSWSPERSRLGRGGAATRRLRGEARRSAPAGRLPNWRMG